MSAERFACVPISYLSINLSGRAFRVFVAIRSFANREGVSFPSLETIHKITGIDRTKLTEIIDEIVEKGAITRERRRNSSNVYRFPLEATVSPSAGTADDEEVHLEGDSGVHLEGDTEDTTVPAEGDTLSPRRGTDAVPVEGDLRDQIEQTKEVKPPTGAKRARESPRRKPRSGIDPNWVPREKNIEFAKSNGKSDAWIERNAPQFVDYHLKNGTLIADVDACWRTWVRNDDRFGAKTHGFQGRRPLAVEVHEERTRDGLQVLAELREKLRVTAGNA